MSKISSSNKITNFFKLGVSFMLIFSLSVSGLFVTPVSVKAEGSVLFVNSAANGKEDGSSWKDAFIDLQSALSASSEGDEIWIAEGTYYPTQDIGGSSSPADARTKTFQMKNEVTILGGFPADDETVGIEGRNVVEHQTVISGDLNRNNSVDSSDAYHVFYHPQGTFLNPTAVLDGVTIAGGNANSYSVTDASNGGGILNNRSHPKLIDVTIENNVAQSSGGGIYNQNSNPIFEGGIVKDNIAGFGGGLYNREGNPTLTNMTFKNNIVNGSGGGIYSNSGKPYLENLVIIENESKNMGGGILTADNGAILKNVKIIGNTAANGAGISISGSALKMEGGEISSNIAEGNGGGVYSSSWNAGFEDVNISSNTSNSGGGVYSEYGTPVFKNSSIIDNTAIYGAGLSVMEGNPFVKDGEINRNKASENGGGVFLNSGTLTVENMELNANTAKNGGGLYSTESSIELLNGEIKGNQATNNGGGIYNYNSTLNLTNGLISGNAALSGGGLYSNYVDDSKLLNVTFAGNKASKGGGIYNSASNPVIQNSIIWGNSSSIYNSGSAPTFEYSLIQDSGGSSAWVNSFGKDLGNNIDTDPGFIDVKESLTAPVVDGNYRLLPESAAVDKGSNNLIPADVVKDLDGNYRKMGISVDLGAYENVVPDTKSPVWPSNNWLGAYGATPKSILLSWNKATDDFGIAGYKIYVNQKLVHDLKQEEFPEYSRVEYVVPGLQPDTNYNFSVVAYDEAGNLSKEITSQGRTERELDEESPVWSSDAELAFQEKVGSGVEMTWPSASDNQGVYHYKISVDGVEVSSYISERLTWNLQDLQPDTSHEISVEAIDYQGNVSEPLKKVYTTLPIWSEDAKLQINENNETVPQLTVPSTESGLVYRYEVLINGEPYHDIYLPGLTSYLNDLVPNTEYDITVNAVNFSGEKLATLSTTFKTLPVWSEGSKLAFSDIRQSSFLVTYPEFESGLIGNVEVLVDGKVWNYVSRNQSAEYIYDLKPDTEYEITLRVFNMSGTTIIEELKEKVKTAPYSDEEPPYWKYAQELKVTEIKETSMKLIWPKATDNEAIKGYRILVDNEKVADVDAEKSEYLITGLTKGTTYTLIVQAYDEKENTGFIRIGVQTASSSNSGGGSGGGQVIVLPPAPPITPAPAPSPAPETPKEPTFPSDEMKDIEGHWAEKQITEAVEKKIVGGYVDGTFRPDNQINRAEFTILLANALGLKGEGKELKFSDNKNIGESARKAIKRAVEAGVVNGFDDGSFRPDQNITRMEMAAMIARSIKLEGDSAASTGFADDSSIPGWARGPIGAMKETGIISGRGNNKFEPAVNATRAETVVMLLRMVKYQEK